MQADRSKLEALLPRIENASAGSRELDVEIAHTFGIPTEYENHEGAMTPGILLGGTIYGGDRAVLTASVDAALALAERVLPEWQAVDMSKQWTGLGKMGDDLPEEARERWGQASLEIYCKAAVARSRHSYVRFDAKARTIPLALCAAIIRAKLGDAE